ncbi:MAG: hypothetical protein RLP15_01265 [Cryomorphaceae bacterium]
MNHDTPQSGNFLITEITVFSEWGQRTDKRDVNENFDESEAENEEGYSLKAYTNRFSSSIRFEVPPVTENFASIPLMVH